MRKEYANIFACVFWQHVPSTLPAILPFLLLLIRRLTDIFPFISVLISNPSVKYWFRTTSTVLCSSFPTPFIPATRAFTQVSRCTLQPLEVHWACLCINEDSPASTSCCLSHICFGIVLPSLRFTLFFYDYGFEEKSCNLLDFTGNHYFQLIWLLLALFECLSSQFLLFLSNLPLCDSSFFDQMKVLSDEIRRFLCFWGVCGRVGVTVDERKGQ